VTLVGRAMFERPARRRAARSAAASSLFADSTLAELAWHRRRSAATRWGWFGGAVGLFIGLLLFAPAAWLAAAVAGQTGQRLLLADATGTVWNGSARVVLTGGAGSRDASALPGRLHWTLRPALTGLKLRATQDCCLVGAPQLRLRPGFSRAALTLSADAPAAGGTDAGPQAVGRWPAAWLAGLGTPWNTLQLEGQLELAARDFQVEQVDGRLRFGGAAQLDLLGVSSRLATLQPLGDYRLGLTATPAGDGAGLSLVTRQGALQLSGNGQWSANGLRFRGEARAAEGTEAALDNLLNIIGRRQGARSVIAIG
jgi:general secretion pathway protein N